MAHSSRYVDEIKKILAITTWQGGFFQKSVVVDGKSITYQFVLAVGLGSSFKRAEYGRRFEREAPAWTNNLHPYTCWKLCQLAMDSDMPLPDVQPAQQREKKR
jgi:hypothetical protein